MDILIGADTFVSCSFMQINIISFVLYIPHFIASGYKVSRYILLRALQLMVLPNPLSPYQSNLF